ncbi:MAG TPA: transposase, partial [Candidatus Hydrogenedentes bacterium]|nr:transposase [Candidatus Hydrogenedentota bacterium]
MGMTAQAYSRYYHRQYGGCGRLWESRYFSCAMDSFYLHNALLYVELNPVRAGLASVPWEYRWSSAKAHVMEKPDSIGLLDMTWWRENYTTAAWTDSLGASLNQSFLSKIRKHTRTGPWLLRQ